MQRQPEPKNITTPCCPPIPDIIHESKVVSKEEYEGLSRPRPRIPESFPTTDEGDGSDVLRPNLEYMLLTNNMYSSVRVSIHRWAKL